MQEFTVDNPQGKSYWFRINRDPQTGFYGTVEVFQPKSLVKAGHPRKNARAVIKGYAVTESALEKFVDRAIEGVQTGGKLY